MPKLHTQLFASSQSSVAMQAGGFISFARNRMREIISAGLDGLCVKSDTRLGETDGIRRSQ